MLLSFQYWIIRLFKSPHFSLLVKNGVVVQKSGNIKINFASECLDTLKRNNVCNACIYGTKTQYGNIVINAAGMVPAEVLQQLRNVWSFY